MILAPQIRTYKLIPSNIHGDLASEARHATAVRHILSTQFVYATERIAFDACVRCKFASLQCLFACNWVLLHYKCQTWTQVKICRTPYKSATHEARHWTSFFFPQFVWHFKVVHFQRGVIFQTNDPVIYASINITNETSLRKKKQSTIN